MNPINDVGNGVKASARSRDIPATTEPTAEAAIAGAQLPLPHNERGHWCASADLVEEARAALNTVPPVDWESGWCNFPASDQRAYRETKIGVRHGDLSLRLCCHTEIGYQPSTSVPLVWGTVNHRTLSDADVRELFDIALGVVSSVHHTTEARAQMALSEAPANLADAEWRRFGDGDFECDVDGVRYLLYETDRGWFRKGERTLEIEFPTIADDLTRGVWKRDNSLCRSDDAASALYDKVQREVSPTWWQLIFG